MLPRLRAALKRSVEAIFSSSAFDAISLRLMRGTRIVLAYHNITSDDAVLFGERSLHLRKDRLAEQIGILLDRGIKCVPLDAPLDAAVPTFSVTFDDAYVGTLRHGLPTLSRLGVPATLFVAPGILGKRLMWWDALAEQSGGQMRARDRHRILREMSGSQELVASSIATRWDPPPDFGISSLHEVIEASFTYPQLAIGAHSMSHRFLPSLTDPELETEIASSFDWITRVEVGNRTMLFAAPYGGIDGRTARIAARIGFSGVLGISGGHQRISDAEFTQPRLNVAAGLSANGLLVRARGMLH